MLEKSQDRGPEKSRPTDAQIEANRRNAGRSTGPQTQGRKDPE